EFGNFYEIKGLHYLKREQFEKSLDYLNKSREILEKNNHPIEFNLFLTACIYFMNDKFEESKKILNEIKDSNLPIKQILSLFEITPNLEDLKIAWPKAIAKVANRSLTPEDEEIWEQLLDAEDLPAKQKMEAFTKFINHFK